MKGKKGTIVVMVILIMAVTVLYYLQNGRTMQVYNSISTTSANAHQEQLTVVANKLYVTDEMACAEEIIKKCRENDFGNVLFSYDFSIPTELHATVYLSEHDVKKGSPAFTLNYTQDSENAMPYNIVDNPQEFKLTIE
ncbi:MAG: hypothetical protein PHD70_06995 [Anaerostipes sp.]|nr:hypothetical protein [Anaerostipes sp.]